jgi:hypothetical protein
MTPRVRATLESLWLLAEKPTEGWVWPAPTQSGHAEPSTFRKAHLAAFEVIAIEAAKRDRKPVRPFLLYDFRHTFLTRLGPVVTLGRWHGLLATLRSQSVPDTFTLERMLF